jgi:hypothetical protein
VLKKVKNNVLVIGVGIWILSRFSLPLESTMQIIFALMIVAVIAVCLIRLAWLFLVELIVSFRQDLKKAEADRDRLSLALSEKRSRETRLQTAVDKFLNRR